jgi:hypothetical protein
MDSILPEKEHSSSIDWAVICKQYSIGEKYTLGSCRILARETLMMT